MNLGSAGVNFESKNHSMPRRVGLVVLVILWLVLIAQHVRVQHQDHGWLLNVYESKLDVKGFFADQWIRVERLKHQCPALQTDTLPEQLLQAIHQYSPPDSASAKVMWLGEMGDWALAEVAFERLNPAVILLHYDAQAWHISPSGIWSGHTHPWRPSPLIRQFLAVRNPQAPMALWLCWQAQHPMWTTPY